ncbi:MAG: hypothetical protein HQK75_16180 [Candidatus Magnetomorum sp.]|nr:hypothetical protein [Candidatus Magnetomorum sp.]
MPKEDKNLESFVSSFLNKLDLATKSDVLSLMDRIDHLEQLIASVAEHSKKNSATRTSKLSSQNISDQILDVLNHHNDSMSFVRLKEVSGLDEKPLRNAIYRLNKLGKIKTLKRGLYTINKEQETSPDA